MERIDKHLSKTIKGVKIYAEGLEEIIDVLSREGQEVTITTDQYKFDDFGEFIGKYGQSEKIDELNLAIHDPYISVEFDINVVRLYAANSNALSVGIFEQVDGILRKWTPKTAILKNGWNLIAFYLFWQAFFYIGRKIFSEQFFNLSIALITAGLIAWAAYYFLTDLRRFNRMVIPHKLGEEKNFFSRNKDNLILIVISTLAGVFFTLIGTYLFDEYRDDILGAERPNSEIGAEGGELNDGTGGTSTSGATEGSNDSGTSSKDKGDD